MRVGCESRITKFVRLGGRGGAGCLPEQANWTYRKQVLCTANVTYSPSIVKVVYWFTAIILDKWGAAGERK